MPRSTKSASLAAQNADENTEKENTAVTDTENAENTATEKPERIKRSPAERAQARLDAAKNRLAKATARRDKVATLIENAEKDVVRAEREVAFRLDDEDLPEQTSDVAVESDDEPAGDVAAPYEYTGN